MIDWFSLLLIGLATTAIVDAWLHDGEGIRPGLFEQWRDAVAYWGEQPGSWQPFRQLLSTLLLCRFCLTYHVALLLSLCYYSTAVFTATIWRLLVEFMLVAFAAAQIAHLIQQYRQSRRAIADFPIQPEPSADDA